MTEKVLAQCDMKPNGVPMQQRCIHCGIVAKGVTEDMVVQSACNREAPKIEASMIEMATSAGKAGADKLLGRAGTRDLMLQARVINVCCRCPKLSGQRCSICGCYLNLKVASDAEICPIGEWTDVLLQYGTRKDIDAVWKWIMEG